MYGTQARKEAKVWQLKFENDVKMYGTQAVSFPVPRSIRLRMM